MNQHEQIFFTPPQRQPDRLPAVRIQSPSIGDDGMLSAWPEGFFDEWENSLDKLLDGEDG